MLVRIHRSPFTPVTSLLNAGQDFDTLFDDMVETSRRSIVREYPPLDVTENDHELVVLAELPGVAKEDVTVSVHDGMLTISGDRKGPVLPEKSSWLRAETRKGRFSRTIAVPETTNSAAISAELTHGVLRIVLPKAEEVRPREITIR